MVDVTGNSSLRNLEEMKQDSLVQVWSNGKTFCSILLAMLADKDKLSFDDSVSKHWPEFKNKGKGFLKIKDVLRHEAGLRRLSVEIPMSHATTENIKLNKIGRVFEEEALEFNTAHISEYHYVTRDMISNEIFRRVDDK